MNNKVYEIDILKLEKNGFNYELFSKDDITVRKIKLFMCLRVLFLADQLHDFTETRAQVGIDADLLQKNLSPSAISIIKTLKKRKMNETIFHKLFEEAFEDILTYANEKISIPPEITNTFKTFKNKNNEFTNYVFLQNYDRLTYGDKSIITKIRQFLITLRDYKAIPKKGEKKSVTPAYYEIVTEISKALGYDQFKIFDKLTDNGIPYFCNLGYDYLKNIAKLRYENRYGTLENVDETNIQITVDADKSRFAVSDIVKVICDLAPYGSNINAEFVKSLSTEYDAAGKSGTESMIENIIDSRRGIFPTENVSITDPGEYNDMEQYILKIDDIIIMDFKLRKISTKKSTINALYEKFKINSIKQEDIKLFPSEYQTFRRNLKNYLARGLTPNTLPNSINDMTKKLGVSNLPSTLTKVEDCRDLFEIIMKISTIINKSSDDIIKDNILEKQNMIITLEINNFFRDYNNDNVDNKNNSVAKIFSKVLPNLKDKNLSHIFAFKTLGDFSQILSFMTNDSTLKNGVYIPNKINKFFITFDKICSRIAPIFIHGILFEHVSKSVVTTLIPFYNKYEDFSSDFTASAIISNFKNTVKPNIPNIQNNEVTDNINLDLLVRVTEERDKFQNINPRRRRLTN